MLTIKTRVSDAYLRIKYAIDCRLEHYPGGLCSFVQSLSLWWRERPRRVLCAGCGYPMWVYGRGPDHATYCSQQCAYSSQSWDPGEDVILF